MAPSIWYLDDKFLTSIFSASSCKEVLNLQMEDKIMKEKRKVLTDY